MQHHAKFVADEMTRRDEDHLTRRERQIMDVIYELEGATAAEVHARLPDPPSYSAVRAMLARLEAKGELRHTHDGPRYVFHPLVSRATARQRALSRLVKVFFDDSPAKAVNALLDSSESLSDEELLALRKAIDAARSNR
jgi:BlaI family penicillinase repressor